jgi:hypothetical protein
VADLTGGSKQMTAQEMTTLRVAVGNYPQTAAF